MYPTKHDCRGGLIKKKVRVIIPLPFLIPMLNLIRKSFQIYAKDVLSSYNEKSIESGTFTEGH